MDKKELRIVYMGTPEFAVAGLRTLVEEGYNVVGVITMPDKPAGRGNKIRFSPVKEYALLRSLPLLQPEKLKNPEFIEQLKAWNPDLQIVVAFRMLPEVVWSLPPYGTFNLHASLLPQYRGAAPINWAVINGEKETGLTTFLLDKEIDTGKILLQEKVAIRDTDDAGSLHDRLMEIGSSLITKTVDKILMNDINPLPQDDLIKDERNLKHAPKIFKETCRINWDDTPEKVCNFIRGLSPYPAAWTELTTKKGDILSLKIFRSAILKESHEYEPGTLFCDGKTLLKVAVRGGYIDLLDVQQAGKKRMSAPEFLRGNSHLFS